MFATPQVWWLVYAIIFYPYVYLASLAGFASISPASREAAASLDQSPAQTLRRVELPQVMPYAIGGALLVVCETVSDYGVAALFATETFSTWAVNHWTHTGDLRTALIVGGLVAVGVLALFALYPVAARPTFTKPLRAPQPARFSLRTGQLMLVYATLGLLMLLAVVAPLLQPDALECRNPGLLQLHRHLDILPWSELAGITSSTVLLGISAAVFAVLLAMASRRSCTQESCSLAGSSGLFLRSAGCCSRTRLRVAVHPGVRYCRFQPCSDAVRAGIEVFSSCSAHSDTCPCSSFA